MTRLPASRLVLWVFGLLVMLFLLGPLLAIVPLSFSAGSFLTYPLPGLSLRWYADFFTSDFWMPALRNSLVIGLGASAIATVLGTAAALFFQHSQRADHFLRYVRGHQLAARARICNGMDRVGDADEEGDRDQFLHGRAPVRWMMRVQENGCATTATGCATLPMPLP